MSVNVRAAVRNDADAIAEAHIEGWRVGYRGVIPDSYLDSDRFASERRQRWRAWTWEGFERSQLFVGELDSCVVAFGHCGPEREAPSCDNSGRQIGAVTEARGEVYGFYAHPLAWGKGVAPALIEACHDALRSGGFRQAVLWVLRDNPRARSFYEKSGWRPTGETAEWPGPAGDPVPELQYLIELDASDRG
jgi:GNAT superfamily N-acetyltransferase